MLKSETENGEKWSEKEIDKTDYRDASAVGKLGTGAGCSIAYIIASR